MRSWLFFKKIAFYGVAFYCFIWGLFKYSMCIFSILFWRILFTSSGSESYQKVSFFENPWFLFDFWGGQRNLALTLLELLKENLSFFILFSWNLSFLIEGTLLLLSSYVLFGLGRLTYFFEGNISNQKEYIQTKLMKLNKFSKYLSWLCVAYHGVLLIAVIQVIILFKNILSYADFFPGMSYWMGFFLLPFGIFYALYPRFFDIFIFFSSTFFSWMKKLA